MGTKEKIMLLIYFAAAVVVIWTITNIVKKRTNE